jgi:hypothetical protein
MSLTTRRLLAMSVGTLLLMAGGADPRPWGSEGAWAPQSAAASAVGSRTSAAQPEDTAAARTHRSASISHRPDFNGDGYADLAVGAPYADVLHRHTGIVHVLHGGPRGLRGGSRQVWSQASEGIADKPERGDHFGWALTHGDFDGDGFSDLAASARWEGPEGRDAGAVHVLYGTPDGLSASRSQLWRQDSPGIPGRPGHQDEFGYVMVAGDFDGDGHDDLAIGTPREDFGARDAGAVQVLYGGPAGLTAARAQAWHQGSPGVADRPETGDGFGKALAAGDFDGDGLTDLAIGAPYESRGINRSGVVHVLRGTRRGLTGRGSQLWHQDAPGVRERAEERDQFGQSLAAGDFDGDGRDDLAVGVWFEDHRNDLSNEGLVQVFYGSRRGLTADRDQLWHQDRPGVLDRRQDSDRFGQALAALDLDGDGFDDLAVGAPSSDLDRGIHQNRGAVHVFRGSRRGLTARGDRYLTQDTPGLADRSEAWDHFGETVAGADFDADGFDDLVIGVPYEDLVGRDDGAVHVVPGSKRGLDLSRDRLWGPHGEGLPRSWRVSSRFGWSLAGERSGDGSPRTGRPDL